MPTRRLVMLGAGLSSVVGRMVRAQAAAEPLPVGALYPLSGAFALLGNESFRGLELATEEVNAAGGLLGRPVRLVKADAIDANQAAAETTRLVVSEKVAAIFGTFSSSLSLATTQVSELAGVPYFELCAAADAVTERGFSNLYRSCPTASQLAALSVDAVTGLLAVRWQRDVASIKLAILHEDGLYGTAIAGFQELLCKAAGLALVEHLAYTIGAPDLLPLVQQLRAAGVDVVLHTGNSSDIVQFYRAMKQAAWRPRMVIGSGPGYSLIDTMQALGADFDGTISAGFTPYRVNERAAPGAAAVGAAYQKRYGAPPRSDHSLANYAGARLFYDTIAHAGSLDKAKLRPVLLATDLPLGTTAAGWGVQFGEKGQNTRARPMLQQWQNGSAVAIAPPEAAVAEIIPKLSG